MHYKTRSVKGNEGALYWLKKKRTYALSNTNPGLLKINDPLALGQSDKHFIMRPPWIVLETEPIFFCYWITRKFLTIFRREVFYSTSSLLFAIVALYKHFQPNFSCSLAHSTSKVRYFCRHWEAQSVTFNGI